MQSELGKLKEENQKLRSMLNQITGNYNSLHLQFITYMQHKSQKSLASPLRSQEVVPNDPYYIYI